MKFFAEQTFFSERESPTLSTRILQITTWCHYDVTTCSRSSSQELFLGKVILKICSKLTREYPCRSVISIKLLLSFTEITLRHGCSPVNLLHFFRATFPKNTYEGLLLLFQIVIFHVHDSFDDIQAFLLKWVALLIMFVNFKYRNLNLCFSFIDVTSMQHKSKPWTYS